VPQIYLRALGFFSVASYDSQSYGGGIRSGLHTGKMAYVTAGGCVHVALDEALTESCMILAAPIKLCHILMRE
jgi:hypothetical protein